MVKIEFDTNGQWFHDENGQTDRQAVAAVIEDIAHRIEHEGATSGAVYDGNGGTVGRFTIEEGKA